MRANDEAKRWFDQAEDDLRWARRLQEEGGHNLACFLAQQVAEKAVKALLYTFTEEAILSHSVHDLCTRAAALVPEIAPHCRRWGNLDSYYITTRYPDALPGGIPADVFDEEASARAVATAAEVVAFVRPNFQA